MNYSQMCGRHRNSMTHSNAVNNQNTLEGWTKGYVPFFSGKGDLGIDKNYRNITHTSIVTKVNNDLLLNRNELGKILQMKMIFRESDP